MNDKDIERFWSKVNKFGGRSAEVSTNCWEWTGNQNGLGYGKFYTNGKHRRVHRVAWELVHGDIPPGEGYHGTCVMHLCNNQLCVNPDHLQLGSQAENMTYRNVLGRTRGGGPAGEECGMAKLTNANVLEIRSLLKQKVFACEIAKRFGVSPGTISHIKTGHTWSHLK